MLAEIAVHFLQPEEFENVANPDFENLKHLQNLGHFCWPNLVYGGMEVPSRKKTVKKTVYKPDYKYFMKTVYESSSLKHLLPKQLIKTVY